MFRIMLISAGTVMHLYVFWRVLSIPFVSLHVTRKVMISFGVILWTGFFLASTIGHGGAGVLAGWIEVFGVNWMAILFLTSVSLLTVDSFTGFGFFMPRIAPSLRGYALVTGMMLSMIAIYQGLRPPVIKDYEVNIPSIPNDMDGKTIVAMSDLHLGSLLGKNWLEARVAQVESLHPDLIVLLGDLFEGHGNPQIEMLPSLKKLSAPLGIWAVPGNHESHGGKNTSMSLIEKANIQVLRNRWVEVQSGLIVAGVDDFHDRYKSVKDVFPISEVISGRPLGVTVLLSHAPVQAEAAATAGVDLMLCGHTHSGQIWPFGYLVKLFYPLLAGEYKVKGMTVIVCRGSGTWGPRMRLWNPGEILRITLRKNEKWIIIDDKS
jgi:predicted MPP superfamily phosphohydrolase